MRLKKYIVAYAVIFTACYTLMPFIVIAAYNDRGYMAVGGEWLLPFAIIGALEIIRLSDVQKQQQKKQKRYYGGKVK